jgi:hypothetical protein
MSGVEIAGTVASHLSSAANSPSQSPITDPEQYSIHHVIQRPVWVFPLHTSPNVRAHDLPCVSALQLTYHNSQPLQRPLSCPWISHPTT